MRRFLATPAVPFFILAEACCFVIMFFRWIAGLGTERIKVNWAHPYL